MAVGQFGRGTPFNDFNDYYFGAKLVAEGRSPYDSVALAEMARGQGVELTLGSGYSYPLPFAIAMLPFTLLPVATAALLFSALSLVAFGVAVAVWLRRVAGGPDVPGRVAVIALLAGAYPPVFGSLFSGQANLVVFALFAFGVLALLSSRTHAVAGAVTIGLAAVVKLVPGAVTVPLLLAGRWREGVAVIATFATALAGAGVVAPFAAAGTGRLLDLLAPDPYFTNQSINGFLSRIVLPSERSVPLVAGAFDPLVAGLALVAAFTVVNLSLLTRARRRLRDPDVLASGIAMVLVAAVIAAPKNSFWNQVVLLVPVGMLLLVDDYGAIRGRDAVERVLLVTWYAMAVVQQLLWAAAPAPAGSFGGVLTLAYSSALYGALALWLLFARRVRRAPAGAAAAITTAPVPDPLVSSSAGG